MGYMANIHGSLPIKPNKIGECAATIKSNKELIECTMQDAHVDGNELYVESYNNYYDTEWYKFLQLITPFIEDDATVWCHGEDDTGWCFVKRDGKWFEAEIVESVGEIIHEIK